MIKLPRTLKISSGAFSNDEFQLTDMFIDNSDGGELDTPLSYVVTNIDNDGDGQLDIEKPVLHYIQYRTHL